MLSASENQVRVISSDVTVAATEMCRFLEVLSSCTSTISESSMSKLNILFIVLGLSF